MRINDETRKNARGERAGGGGGGGGVTRYFAVARLRAPLECEIRRIGLGSLAAWTEHMLRAGSSASSAGADFNSSGGPPGRYRQ